jgi:YVTN family beta-propeller protein
MASQPSGVVTFVFTDIEGSTLLVRQLRDRYSDVLAEHQRLLRAAFGAHRGYEVDTQGDSFFVAFPTAREALVAAVEGQRALLSHTWPEGVAVKVRMGLHTGQVVAADGRYTGLAVHRAARIAAAGHGGQILVSQATQTLLEDEEEDLHVFLRDLGEQRLKDFNRPVHLYQAAADGLPASFPPLRPEAELGPAGEAALPTPLWRRPAAFAAAAVLVALVAAAIVLVTRGSESGLAGVRPDHVGIIDPETNEIAAEVPVGIRPGPLAVGHGAVWVGNLEDRTLTRLDARARMPVATLALDNRTPTGIAVGAAAVWVAHGLRGQLSRVDPQFNRVVETLNVSTSVFQAHTGAVTVAAGSVWAVYGDSTLVRVDPRSTRIAGSAFTGAAPAAVGSDGTSVWVANSADATVQRFNPATFAEGPVSTITVGRRPAGIAFGERSIWVTSSGDDAVTRIDPGTASTITIRVGDEPTGIAVGAGAVWVANTGDGTVSRIDAATNEVTGTIELGNPPSGIAIADGVVWVALQAPPG